MPATQPARALPDPGRHQRRPQRRRVGTATDWRQILQLYDQLIALAPGPIVALNRAVAVAEIEGPAAALAIVERLDLNDYYLFHAIRADLLRRLGRGADADTAYARAAALTANAAERMYLEERRYQGGSVR